MSVFISDIDTVKLYVRYIFRPLAQCAALLKCWFIRIRVVAYESLKVEVQLGNPKSGRGRLREIFITKFKSKFQRGFTKVVETWAGRLRLWS